MIKKYDKFSSIFFRLQYVHITIGKQMTSSKWPTRTGGCLTAFCVATVSWENNWSHLCWFKLKTVTSLWNFVVFLSKISNTVPSRTSVNNERSNTKSTLKGSLSYTCLVKFDAGLSEWKARNGPLVLSFYVQNLWDITKIYLNLFVFFLDIGIIQKIIIIPCKKNEGLVYPHSQCHGCWWSGDARIQDTNIHGVA